MIVKNFMWKEHKVNNINTNPLEEWYCIIDIGNGNAKKYSIRPQYPSKDGVCIDTNLNPEYYILFESNGHIASTEEQQNFFYRTNNFDGYIFKNDTFIRVFKNINDAKKRAYFNYEHVYNYCLKYININEIDYNHKII